MTKTIFIGDTHLKFALIAPLLDKIISTYNINQVVFMGDYTDLRGQQKNRKLYIKDLVSLQEWSSKMENVGIDVIHLLGNHDCHYLVYEYDEQAPYSVLDKEIYYAVRDTLENLNLQIAVQIDDYLVSHAGFNQLFDLEDWHSSLLFPEEHLEELQLFTRVIGPRRAGKDATFHCGSPIWADISEFEIFYNENYPKQIVGHTPQTFIDLSKSVIGIDTFTVDEKMNFYGNGDILLYDSENKEFSVIPTNWKTVETLDKLKKYIGGK